MTDDLRALYPTARWRRHRAAFLRQHPICAWPGCGARATIVDHVVPRSRGGSTWSRDNWQPLCRDHHQEKTARERGWKRRRRADSGAPAETAGSEVVTRDYTRSDD